MKIRSLAIAVLILTLLGSLHRVAPAAAASTTTLLATADAYVDSGKPATNFGSSLTESVRGGSPTRRALFRFNLSSIPAGAKITSASLKLYVASDGSAVAGTVKSVGSSWSESTITYSNTPSVGPLIATIPGAATANASVSVNITSWVVSVAPTRSAVSMYVVSSSTDNVAYYSREKGSTLAPRLIITWNPPATPTRTPTRTAATRTPTRTATSVPSATATNTVTPSPTLSPTASFTPTATLTTTATQTATATRTRTPTPSITFTATSSRTATSTRTVTPTRTASTTPTTTSTPTQTSTPSQTMTPTSTSAPDPASPTATSPSDWQPSFPIRAAYYYPWFPEAWTQLSTYPYTYYHPQLGFYSSSDSSILKTHIDMMQYGGIQAGIASWWGQDSKTDSRVPALLSASSGTNFRWSLYYENESLGDPTSSQIQDDLTYIRDHYAADPSYLRVDDKFVVFVYADAIDGCGMADRWKQGNTVGAFVVLKVFAGYLDCASQPDDWHQYSPAVAEDGQGIHSFSISPGFWLMGNSERLTRDLARWSQNVRDMVASGSRWQLVTTFSEWGEGTVVEPATEWASASGYGLYLDALHNNGAVSSDPVVMAAGDIVCPDLVTTDATCQQMAVSQLIVDQQPDAVLPLGDLCQNTSVNCFSNYYGPSWGRLFSISHPITGNHEYGKTGAQYYFDYWNGIGVLGGPAGDRGKGYYSLDIGTWHVIALNSQCEYIGGCDVGSPEYSWLQQDLQLHPSQCTLALSHKPVFGSASLISADTRPLWQLLYDANADVILDGHSHTYERFAPQDPNAVADPLRGIREFIVGTGGSFHTGIGTIAANSEVRNAVTFGALKLTLRANGYDWQFLPIPGQTFTDSGTALCH